MYKIAIGIDLGWPYAHHYETIRGIHMYGLEHSIECSSEPWLEVSQNFDEYPMNFDGIVARTTPALAKYCQENSIPLVNVWENSPVADIPTVTRNLSSFAKKMVAYFVNRGFHKISFLVRENDGVAFKMSQYFLEELKSKNLDIQDSSVFKVIFPETPDDWVEFNQTLSSWVNSISFPTALCTSDYLMARYFIEWCKKHDILIPDDIAVLSASDNELICETLEPTLSHIKNNFTDHGYQAAKCLHQIMLGKNPEPCAILPGNLIEKKSTHVEPVEDRVIAKALRFIRDNTSSQIQVIDVADAVGLERRSLERRFRKHLDRSINNEILRAKIEAAKKLLIHSDKTLTEVAKLTGISTGQRLSQLFRKHLNQSITEFRKKHQISK